MPYNFSNDPYDVYEFVFMFLFLTLYYYYII